MPFFARKRDFNSLRVAIERHRQKLLAHPIYGEIDSIERLRLFMQVHVFAVWDFMSLAKRLQRELTCTELPWRPPSSPKLARFANEVILTEETDLDPSGAPSSHLELYLRAMSEIGASAAQFEYFLSELSGGRSVADALQKARVPEFIRDFVNATVVCATSAPTVTVLASFLFGREDLIPDMFQRLLPACERHGIEVASFEFYLRRHIELDGDEHGPIAREALTTIARGNRDWKTAERGAIKALNNRLRLWDGICEVIDSVGARDRRMVQAPAEAALAGVRFQ